MASRPTVSSRTALEVRLSGSRKVSRWKTPQAEIRLKRLQVAFLDIANFILRYPGFIGIKEDDKFNWKERYKAAKLREYLQRFAEASKDICCYCNAPVVLSQGERVCTKEGHVQPDEAIRVTNIFYRQVMNYGVWDKNLGTDPMETFKIVKTIIHRDHGINIRSPTDTRRFGDPEDLMLRDLLGFFSWTCTQAGIPPHVISSGAKVIRKRHRRYLEELLAREKKEALSLALDIKKDLLNHDGRAQIALQGFLSGNMSLDGDDDPQEQLAREWVGRGGGGAVL
jgi:hypothetical protein